MSSLRKFALVAAVWLVASTAGNARAQDGDEREELGSISETKNEDTPVWWHTCSSQPVTSADASSEGAAPKFIVSENHLEALIRVSANVPTKVVSKLLSIEARMTLTRRTISVKDTFRSTSFRSLNPNLASSNVSLADLQPYLMRDIYESTTKCHWLLFKLKNTGKLCFEPIIKSIRELLCSRINCFPQNLMLLRWWLPKFQSLITHNASRVYNLKAEFEAMELFVQMVAATLEAFQHNEQIMNGPYLSLVGALNQCTLNLLCSLRLLIEQMEVIKELSRVPMFDADFKDLLSPDRLLYRRGKSVMKPMYKDRLLSFKEKVPRDLLPGTEQITLREPEQNLRAARLASVAFDLESLFAFLN